MSGGGVGLDCFSGMSRLLLGGEASGKSEAGKASGKSEAGKASAQARADPKAGRLTLPGGRIDRIREVLPGGPSSGLNDVSAQLQDLGAETLRHLWATFAALDIQGAAGSRWTERDLSSLRQTRIRCLAACAPFQIVVRLLEDNWMTAGRAEEEELLHSAAATIAAEGSSGKPKMGPEALRKAREAAAAAKASEQWNVLLAVQHVIGRSPGEAAPVWKEMQQELPKRREKLLFQARSFKVIAGLLESEGFDGTSHRDLEARCRAELRLLVAAQGLVPAEWKELK